MSFVVYEHWLNGKCFYIGSGNEHRPYTFRRNEEYNKLVKGRKKDIVVVIHSKHDTKEEAFNEEKKWTIEMFKKYNLTNKMYGTSAPGELNGFYGKKHSEEAKMKISFKNKGNIGWLKGKHLSKEVRLKISKSKTGSQISEDVKQKISIATKGENNPMFGKSHSKKSMTNMVKNRKDFGKILLTIEKDGKIETINFESINQASRYSNVASHTIARKTKNGNKYIFKNMTFERVG